MRIAAAFLLFAQRRPVARGENQIGEGRRYGGVMARWNLTGALLVDSPAMVNAFERLTADVRNDQPCRLVEV